MAVPGEQLLIKMWETLTEKGIGSLLKPWQTGREGRALNEVRRHEILMLAQAEKDAAEIRAGRKQLQIGGANLLALPPLEQPAADVDRLCEAPTFMEAVEHGNRTAAYAAARSEINSSKAILFAEEQLAKDTGPPPAQTVDDDWLHLWRDYAGEVSAEDLQRMWGSVLAGEVKAPGRYSLRTLEFLKTLSKREAEEISRLASYVFNDYVVRKQKSYLDSKGLTFSALLALQEIGVLSGVEAIGLNKTIRSQSSTSFVCALISHNKALIVEHADPTKECKLEIYKITKVGREILGLGSFEPDLEYMRRVGLDIVAAGFKVSLADWRDLSETEGRYFNSQEIVVDPTAR